MSYSGGLVKRFATLFVTISLLIGLSLFFLKLEKTEDVISEIELSDVPAYPSGYPVPPLEHHSPPAAVLEQGSGMETASYIIFKDSESWIYAKNGSSGAIDFSGTNASDVIQNAMNQLISGGKIFIKAAQTGAPYQEEYFIDSKLIPLKDTIIDGDGAKLITSSLIFYINVPNVTIKNLHLSGHTEDGIYIASSGSYSKILDNSFNEFESYIFVDESDHNEIVGNQIYKSRNSLQPIISVKDGNYNTISRNTIVSKPVTCEQIIEINGSVTGAVGNIITENHIYGNDSCNVGISLNSTDENIISNNYIKSANYGIIIESLASNNLITNNRIKDMDKAGIRLYKSENMTITGNHISNVTIQNYAAGINVSNSNYTIISGNRIDRVKVGIDIDSSNHLLITDNMILASISTPGIGIWGKTINNNSIRGNTLTRGLSWEIRLDWSDYNLIADNYIDGDDISAIVLDPSSDHNVLKGNYILRGVINLNSVPTNFWGSNNALNGTACETSGTSYDILSATNNTTNTVSIEHGICQIPTSVRLTSSRGNVDGEPVILVWNRTNTNITHLQVSVYVANGSQILTNVSDIDVSWYAEYKP